jgi:hypothetical protein
VTKEQTIVLGFLVAAFIAGWAVHALTGRRDRQPAEGAAASPPVEDGRLRRAIEESRHELDVAVRSYLTAIAASLGASGPGKAERGGAAAEPAAAAADKARPEEEPAAAEAGGLADEVSAALSDDAANESMLSVLDGDHGARLSERELDLADWGFAYGVAWARAREREPMEPGDEIAQEALRAADTVFRAYAAEASWEHPAGASDGEQGSGNGRARQLRPRP